MTEEDLINLKNDYVEHIKKFVSQTGGIFPHLSVFAEIRNPETEEEKKPALIHIPVPDNFMKNDEMKDKFVDEVVPEIFQEIKTKFIPKGVAWASEAWVRTTNDPLALSNYKKLPKREVIIISMETDNDTETIIYNLYREGMQVNDDGELTEKVRLEQEISDSVPSKMEGRFTGLFKKF